ncbi:MAG: hypothetical protein KC431_29645, partial [Myxococcales bacterium]|nr:hypothetical protein [Myxococcales bacterium]
MPHGVQQRQNEQRRRGTPLVVLLALFFGSSIANVVAVGGALELLETEPWQDHEEELFVVDLTEPAEPEPEELEKEEPEKEKEELEPEKEKPDLELVEPEPEPEPEQEEPEPEPEPEPEQEPEPPPELE